MSTMRQSYGDILSTDGWAERCKEKSDRGVLMRRIRIIEKPYTPYTAWEIEHYKHINLPSGEQVFTVAQDDVGDLRLPSGDLMMFDNKRAVVCAYDQTGRMTHQTFYDESDGITMFLQLMHALMNLAQPLQTQ